MTEADNGQPQTGQTTGRQLGARPDTDIPIEDGRVKPGTGGMSITPHSHDLLPPHRRPPELGGTGKDPVWKIGEKQFGDRLIIRADPDNPTRHAFAEPAHEMTWEEYLQALYNTAGAWTKQ